jgi:hypothetical protein
MREIRTWGSVRGVLGDRHPYRDQRWRAPRAPIRMPGLARERKLPPIRSELIANPGPKALNSGVWGVRPRGLDGLVD